MTHYLKLVHMEIFRFRYFLLGMMLVTAIMQHVVISIAALNEMEKRLDPGWNQSNSIFQNGKMSFSYIMFNNIQPLYALPVLLCMMTLILYVFLIWYRDWFGRRTFIYRLLMLPASRKYIYLSKLTAIFIFVMGMIAFQVVMLNTEQVLFNMIVPNEMRVSSTYADAIETNIVLAVLLPRHFDQFICSYGLGMIGVMVLFTAVLLERSYGRLGILYASIYAAACSTLAIFSYRGGLAYTRSLLYPSEKLIIFVLVIGLIGVVSLISGFRLIEKKVTV